MKILIVSDSHLFDNDLDIITEKYKNQVDLMIHCGDSSLPIDDKILQYYSIVVLGNHDDSSFLPYVIYNDICVTHGHLYKVYRGYKELIQLCKENQCRLCFHGHTHVPTHQIYENIHFINPGSLMMNRGSYGYGTYAIVNNDDENKLVIDFYHHKTHQKCSHEILEEGLVLLEEFKKLA